MAFYVNDNTLQVTILSCRTDKEASVYATWANEYLGINSICVETEKYDVFATGEQLLSYFGFTVDSIVEQVFALLPIRSRVESNVELIKTMLRETNLSKALCCQHANKYPEHYSRLSKTLGQYCSRISGLTGGRNPMKLLRGIRGDI